MTQAILEQQQAATPALSKEDDNLLVNRIVNGKLVPCRWSDLTAEEQRAAYCNQYTIY